MTQPRIHLWYGIYESMAVVDGDDLLAFRTRKLRDSWVRTGLPSPSAHPDAARRKAIIANRVYWITGSQLVKCGDCSIDPCQVCDALTKLRLA